MDLQALFKLFFRRNMHSLDNPIWQALSTVHAPFAQVCNSARRFPREVSVLAGFAEPTAENYASLASLFDTLETIRLFLQSPPDPPSGWTVGSTGPLLQMLYDHASAPKTSAANPVFTKLGPVDVPEMLALTRLTTPGPFSSRTCEMGDYFGIRVDGVLAAMAGERLRLPGYTEISAVCTHPDYLGRGYASILIRILIERIRNRGERPFLHVRPQNTRAVQLYERLGFRRRACLHYCSLRSNL